MQINRRLVHLDNMGNLGASCRWLTHLVNGSATSECFSSQSSATSPRFSAIERQRVRRFSTILTSSSRPSASHHVSSRLHDVRLPLRLCFTFSQLVGFISVRWDVRYSVLLVCSGGESCGCNDFSCQRVECQRVLELIRLNVCGSSGCVGNLLGWCVDLHAERIHTCGSCVDAQLFGMLLCTGLLCAGLLCCYDDMTELIGKNIQLSV